MKKHNNNNLHKNDNLINEIPNNISVSMGTYTNRQFRESKKEDRETDVYYKIREKLPISNVAIPTYDAVVEAKDWVDNENRK